MSAWNLTEHEWEILQHKRLQLLQHWEFRKKIKDSSVPDFLIWGWVVNEAALRSSFSSSQSGVGRFIRKIPSQFPLSWLLQPEPGGSAALSDLWLAESIKLCSMSRIWKGFEVLVLPQKLWMNSGGFFFFFDAPHTSERSSSCWFLFGSLGFFSFLSFMWTKQCLMFFRALLLRTQLIFVVQFTLKMWSYLLGEGNVPTR